MARRSVPPASVPPSNARRSLTEDSCARVGVSVCSVLVELGIMFFIIYVPGVNYLCQTYPSEW